VDKRTEKLIEGANSEVADNGLRPFFIAPLQHCLSSFFMPCVAGVTLICSLAIFREAVTGNSGEKQRGTVFFFFASAGQSGGREQ